MALPTSGPLSLFAIFKEIYGREPNIGERVSFHDLVNRSNLADKSFPCPFSRFYGYQHGYSVTLTTNLSVNAKLYSPTTGFTIYLGTSDVWHTSFKQSFVWSGNSYSGTQSNAYIGIASGWVLSHIGLTTLYTDTPVYDTPLIKLAYAVSNADGTATANGYGIFNLDTSEVVEGSITPALSRPLTAADDGDTLTANITITPVYSLTDNRISIGTSISNGIGTIQATSTYAVASDVEVTGEWQDDLTGSGTFTITIPAAESVGSTIVELSSSSVINMEATAADVSPTSDDTYSYLIN